MTHYAGHIICGTAGEELGVFLMKVRRGSVLTLALRYRPENAVAQFNVNEKDAAKAGKAIQKHIDGIYKELHKIGVPVHYHQPLPENLDPPPA